MRESIGKNKKKCVDISEFYVGTKQRNFEITGQLNSYSLSSLDGNIDLITPSLWVLRCEFLQQSFTFYFET